MMLKATVVVGGVEVQNVDVDVDDEDLPDDGFFDGDDDGPDVDLQEANAIIDAIKAHEPNILDRCVKFLEELTGRNV